MLGARRPVGGPVLALITLVACASGKPRIAAGDAGTPSLAGDWDAWFALGTTPHAGFEGWRRLGFAHFAPDTGALRGAIRRRTGDTILAVSRVTASGDSVMLSNAGSSALSATWRGDTLAGVLGDSGRATGPRIRLVRRAAPFVVPRLRASPSIDVRAARSASRG